MTRDAIADRGVRASCAPSDVPGTGIGAHPRKELVAPSIEAFHEKRQRTRRRSRPRTAESGAIATQAARHTSTRR